MIQRSSDGGKTWQQPGGAAQPIELGRPSAASYKFVNEEDAAARRIRGSYIPDQEAEI